MTSTAAPLDGRITETKVEYFPNTPDRFDADHGVRGVLAALADAFRVLAGGRTQDGFD